MPRILVADDEAPIREMLQIACELDGHEVLAVDSADEAIVQFAIFRPDLMILDINMPGGGGERVIREVKALGSSCPSLVVTGLGGSLEEEDREQIGATEILSKPFSIDSLRIAVKTALAGSSSS